VKQTHCRTAGRSDTFAFPPDSGNIVRRVVNGGFSDIELLEQDVVLSNSSGQLQLTVVDIAPWVFECY
jgi:hypothetical protein